MQTRFYYSDLAGGIFVQRNFQVMSVLKDYFVAQVDADEHRELGERYGVTVRALLSLLPVNGRSFLACSWLGVRVIWG